MINTILAADIGGSHITSALVNLRERSIVSGSIARKAVDPSATTAEVIDTWATVLLEARGHSDACNVAISIPSPFDYENGISYLKGQNKYDALYGANIKELLSRKLGVGVSAIKMKNDAACFLQGEFMCGGGNEYSRGIGVTLGTGLGSAYCVEGESHDADLWGMPFKETIAEEYLSTRWFVRAYNSISHQQLSGVKQLVECYDDDKNVQLVFNEFAVNLSEFLINLITRFDPQVIILGGNIIKAGDYFLPQVGQLLRSRNIHCPVRRAVLGENAAMIGAAYSWNNVERKPFLF